MSEPQWTPGPWRAYPTVYTEATPTGWLVGASEGLHVTHILGPRPTARANAYLIAEAPTMYKGIEELVRQIGSADVPSWILDSMAKARGEE